MAEPSAPPALDSSLSTSDLLRSSAHSPTQFNPQSMSRPASLPGSMEDNDEQPEFSGNKLPPLPRNAVQPMPPSEAIPGAVPIGWRPPINTDVPATEVMNDRNLER